MTDAERNILIWLCTIEDSTLGKSIVNLNDGAGITRLGITSANWLGRIPASFWTPECSPDSALEIALIFYDTHYWQQYQLSKLPMPVAASVLSALVDCGPQSLNWYKAHPALTDFIVRWKAHYLWLSQQKPGDAKFLDGWYARAAAIYPELPK